jgi:plastocyanin
MPYTALLSGFALAFTALAAQGMELIVLDQQGRPLPDVAILVDGDLPPSEVVPVMDQVAMRFAPNLLVVPRGTEVQFPNSDEVRHHVYSFSQARRFELRLFKGTDAPPVLFDEPGLVVLGCNIHDQMVGYILVTDSPVFAVSDQQGRVQIPSLSTAADAALSWWHPSLGETPPRSVGELALGTQPVSVSLPVTLPEQAEPAPQLSPLQQRFREARRDASH